MRREFFEPKSIAVVGASSHPEKVGHVLIYNLVRYNFPGAVYPINPNASEILGLRAYPSVTAVSQPIDLAVIVVPAPHVLTVLEDCGKKGIHAAIIISAGFKESGTEGAQRERELTRRAKELGIEFIGPNCFGVIDTRSQMNATFSAGVPPEGEVAFFSQSGALCVAVLDWAAAESIGFSKFISIGNKAVLTEIDILEALADDPHSRVVMGYLEGVSDGPAFMEVARRITRKKPLIIIKAGGTSAGARAAASHTGTLAGSERVFGPAFRQGGVIRADSMEDLFNFAKAFAYEPMPAGPNVAIITNAGGPGILVADACEKSGLSVPALQKATVDTLRKSLPPMASMLNPIDVIGDAMADRYQVAIEAAMSDPGVHSLLVVLTAQELTEVEKTAELVVQASSRQEKPVLAAFLGREHVEKGIEVLNRGRTPNYIYPEDAVRSLRTMVDYKRWLERPQSGLRHFDVGRERAAQVIAEALRSQHHELGEQEGREILTAYGFAMPKHRLAETAEEAAAVAEEIGYPVVMKIVSPDVLHKSDIAGVALDLENRGEVTRAFTRIVTNVQRHLPRAQIWGVDVQEMVTGGKEAVLGLTRDPTFGPVIMFGLGGIYVEVLKDISLRVCPLDPAEARSMIREIRSFPLFQGVRGEPPSDLATLEECLLRLSQLAMDHPEICEADINPVLVKPAGEGAVALDARFILQEECP